MLWICFSLFSSRRCRGKGQQFPTWLPNPRSWTPYLGTKISDLIFNSSTHWASPEMLGRIRAGVHCYSPIALTGPCSFTLADNLSHNYCCHPSTVCPRLEAGAVQCNLWLLWQLLKYHDIAMDQCHSENTGSSSEFLGSAVVGMTCIKHAVSARNMAQAVPYPSAGSEMPRNL